MLRPILLVEEAAADQHLDAQRLEEIRADAHAAQYLWLVVINERHLTVGIHGYAFKRSAAESQFTDSRRRDEPRGPMRIRLRQAHDGCWIAIRELPQQHRLDDAENGGIKAHADREGRDRRGGDGRRLAQHSEGKTRVPDAF